MYKIINDGNLGFPGRSYHSTFKHYIAYHLNENIGHIWGAEIEEKHEKAIDRMKKALLVIGEEKIATARPYLSFVKFVKYARRLDKKVFELKVISYEQLLSDKLPPIEAGLIKVILFFPYKFWNQHIEIYRDGRIYGDKKFGQDFKAFLRKVKRTLAKCYGGKRIEYLNRPQACVLDRDKKASKKLWRRKA